MLAVSIVPGRIVVLLLESGIILASFWVENSAWTNEVIEALFVIVGACYVVGGILLNNGGLHSSVLQNSMKV